MKIPLNSQISDRGIVSLQLQILLASVHFIWIILRLAVYWETPYFATTVCGHTCSNVKFPLRSYNSLLETGIL